MAMLDLVIIGAGPAGLTAGIYAARARLDTLILGGDTLGGQMALTYMIENYPGFPDGIVGTELAQSMRAQAERFGTQIRMEEVTEVRFDVRPFQVITAGGDEVEARTLIIATGVSPRKLDVPGEAKFTGRGVSYCATCDGFFFRGKELVVVGGGDSAAEEGHFLTRFAERVRIVHRRDSLRAEKHCQERAFRNEKVEFIWDTVVTEILGNQTVEAVRLRNVKTGNEWMLPTDGVFIYIGNIPNTDIFVGKLELNQWGFIIADGRQQTSVPGVFAAGDVLADMATQQIAVATGTGTIASIEAERYLAERH
jgi:thioredoxin reductase (NADPH)